MSRTAAVWREGDGFAAVVVGRRFGRARFVRAIGPAPAEEAAEALRGLAAEVRVLAPEPVARRLVALPGRPTREALAFEVEPDLPWPAEEAAVGATPIGRGRYAVSAARRSGVEAACAPFRDLPARVVAVDAAAAAAAAAVRLAGRRSAAVLLDGVAAVVEGGRVLAVRPAEGLGEDEAVAAAAAAAEVETPAERVVVVGAAPASGEGTAPAPEEGAATPSGAVRLDVRARLGVPPAEDVPIVPLLAAAAPAGFPVVDEVERPSRGRAAAVAAALAVLLALGAGGLEVWAAARRRDAWRERALEAYRTALPRGRGAAPRIELERAVRVIEGRRDRLEAVVSKKGSAARALARLAAAAPVRDGAPLRLVEFRARDGALALIAEAATADDASALERAAGAESGLADVRLPEVRTAPSGRGVRFTLEASYAEGGGRAP